MGPYQKSMRSNAVTNSSMDQALKVETIDEINHKSDKIQWIAWHRRLAKIPFIGAPLAT